MLTAHAPNANKDSMSLLFLTPPEAIIFKLGYLLFISKIASYNLISFALRPAPSDPFIVTASMISMN